jgi:hypothetical protein
MAAPLILFVLALAIRAASGALFLDPAYPDSLYYVNVARALAAGDGFQVDYIWNFVDVGGRLPPDPRLPIPSNAHWMPLAALIQVPFIWLLGPTPLASSIPFWLAAATTAPLTYAIARDAAVGRGGAIAAGLMVALAGAVSPFLSQPDNFALFMPLGALALWLCGRGVRGDRRAFVVGGVVVGLATLSRNDGVLLGVPFALAFGRELLGHATVRRIGWSAAVTCAAAFVVVTAPWWARQLAVFGSLAPSAASGRILWIASYHELYSISSETTVASFLAQGPASLLASRLSGLAAAVGLFTLMPLVLVLTPFTAVGAWARRRDPRFVPWLIYAGVLVAFSALLFAVHVPHGTFLHSAVALVPHAFVAALIGIAAVVRVVAGRRASWDATRATAVFTAGAVAVTALGAVAGTMFTARGWGAERDVRLAIAEVLRTLPDDGPIMTPDPGSYRYHAGRGGVVTPDDPLPVIEEAARAYGVRWLVVERAHVVPALVPVLAGTARPPWLSSPVATLDAAFGPSAGRAPGEEARADTEAAASLPTAVLVAVCLEPSDARCRP